jgi:hypothetical protein
MGGTGLRGETIGGVRGEVGEWEENGPRAL